MASTKVLVLYYSGSGNTKKMAKAIAEAMKSSAISVTVEDVGKFDISLLPKYGGIVLGSPTYFSNVAWQVKKVIDESIVHYGGGKLKGKVAGIFTSAGTSRDGKDCLKMLEASRFKLISFLISAFFGGLAGGLYALHLNFVPLETLNIMTSGDVVIMSIIGGIGTLYGPIFGAMLLVYLKNLMSGWTEQWNLIMGILFIISVLTLRRGILVEVKERFFRKG